MAGKQRLLRMSLAHYRKDGCSERDCHYFGSDLHAKQAATVHASHGTIIYKQIFSTEATRGALEKFKNELGAPWVIEDHDLTVELYVRDMAALRAIATDPEFAKFSKLEEPYLSYRHVVASLAWVEVYIEDGKVVNVQDGESGKSEYEPSFEEFVKEGGLLQDLLK